MNIQKLNKEQKIGLLTALAAGKITKEHLPGEMQMDSIFVKFQTYSPIKYTIAGEEVSEEEFNKRLELAEAILGDKVIYIVVKYVNHRDHDLPCKED